VLGAGTPELARRHEDHVGSVGEAIEYARFEQIASNRLDALRREFLRQIGIAEACHRNHAPLHTCLVGCATRQRR
jgi:hypothetical protein